MIKRLKKVCLVGFGVWAIIVISHYVLFKIIGVEIPETVSHTTIIISEYFFSIVFCIITYLFVYLTYGFFYWLITGENRW